MKTSQKITYAQLLKALLDEENRLPPSILYRLSDLTPPEAQQLQKDWDRIPAWRRQALLEDLEQLGDSDLVLFYDAVCRIALYDSQAAVRALALRIIGDYQSEELIPLFIQMMNSDQDAAVRAEAASALAPFVYLGEIEEISEAVQHQVEDALLKVTTSNDESLVRRRALEALGYSARPEVAPLIDAAYTKGKEDWLVSALFAMGRSANEEWQEQVLACLDDPRPAVTYEAICAAGELEIKQAVPRLMEILDGNDPDLTDAAIWSLSQIGGVEARTKLEQLLEACEDDEEADYLEDALDNLTFTEGLSYLEMFEYTQDDPNAADDDLDWLDDNDEEDEADEA